MGISGLLPFLKKTSRGAHLREFKGQTAAVDAYCWLHKGAFSCADKLVKGEQTNGYVIYVMKQVNLLLSHGIKPIMVFDGCHLPSKAGTETKRRENRDKNRRLAKELLRQGRTREAREHFQRCVEVTSDMAFEVINACRARNIDVIVAPYEADAQLAFLNLSGVAQVVITEDSDLIVFGCKAILFKMDSNGGCMLVEKEKLHLSLNIPRDKFSFEKFRNITILSGCDYLPSLPGIGLAKACKFFTVTANTDVYNVLCKLPSYLNMPNLEVTKEYRDKFLQAINTFLYQLVFDPISQTLRPLTDYPNDTGPQDYPYAGHFVGHERARQIALGNVNVQTGDVVDHYDPETYKPPVSKSSSWERKENTLCPHQSIWTKDPPSKKQETPNILHVETRPATTRKEVTVTFPLMQKKRELELVDDVDDMSDQDLMNLYSQPTKQKKVEASLESPESAKNNLVKSSDKDHIVELHDKDSHTASPVKTSPEGPEDNDNCTKSSAILEHSRHRNPFAKKQTSPKKNDLQSSNYKNLKIFSKKKKTMIDTNVIIESRFFSNGSEKPSNNSESPVESEVDEAVKQNIDASSTPRSNDVTLHKIKDDAGNKKFLPSSPAINSKSTCKGSFNWKKYSYVGCNTLKLERSEAAASSFRSVLPKHKHKPLEEEDGRQKQLDDDGKHKQLDDDDKHKALDSDDDVKDEMLSCVENSLEDRRVEESDISTMCPYTPPSSLSLCSDVNSIDNESFGLTPSLPSSLECSEVTPLKDATNFPSESYLKSSQEDVQQSTPISKTKWRTPGLQRNFKKKEPGKKQLSLTDLFTFKRDERKLQK